ncbi:transcription-repair coupling factor [soil metagenome]
MADSVAVAPRAGAARVASARLAGLLELASASERFRELRARVERGGSVPVSDASAGARAWAWSALVAGGRSVLVVAPSEDRARRWVAELHGWLGEAAVVSFPERETMPYEIGEPSPSAVHGRLLALWGLRDGAPRAVVASLRALLQHTAAPPDLAARSRVLRAGDRIAWRETAAWLLMLGYDSVPEVSEPGTFSRRGGIIDVYPAAAERPARIELFGDVIETLRSFEPVTQRSQEPVAELLVLPTREYGLDAAPSLADRLAAAGWDDLADREELAGYGKILEPLRNMQYAPGTDAFATALGAGASLLDHLDPAASTVVFEDSVELGLQWDTHEAQAEEKRDELQAQGLPVGVLPPQYAGRGHLEHAAARRGLVRVEPGPAALRLGWSGAPSYAGRLDTFLREVAAAGRGTRVMATPQAARLAELLAERDVTAVPLETLEEPPARGALVLLHVPLAEGFRVEELDLAVFTDLEVFGFRKPRHPERQRRRRAVGTLLQDLRPGDHVVHEDSGIARFEGFEDKLVSGVSRESLVLTFADGTRWLPTERIDKITRYVGGSSPPLSVMGGVDWLKTRRKAKKAAEEIARELLRLYAAREAAPGLAFSRDTPWQIEIENAFPFTETPDQLTATLDVKRDMEESQPMDRLIVGDVGYGKTEVALRAAFKAVMDGKQVAVLVPTTVLAQQHHETFSERLATFPVRIGMLSRFRSPQEQKATAAALATGEIDIVVGTHRVLQRDVAFRDLGLVVIDEEHRFGVRHKERLKALRTHVDVLSMTATPIPRTLQMALSGVLDISVIETPPEDRQPIETRVLERSDDVLREAILREIDRGGQVYYVHNRVMGIQQETNRLRELVPTARFVVGHGQMHERELERVMVEFADAEHDVLVCTTIIESGLDIPNVNTIIIDRAGTLGLAQLYQLRGRVGRSAEKAYAYLLHHKDASLTEQAQQRLQAIFEASELGAGFKIAMHDLEIRGAGNILGAEQHGHVAAVGFELYAQLLEEAVQEQRGLRPHAPPPSDVVVELSLSTAIPDDYIPSRARKLETYRRIAELRLMEELSGLREELRDRYGAPPEPVRNLLFGVEVKLRAARAGASEVRVRGPEMRVVLGRDIQQHERAALVRAFPRIQHGQRQLRLAVPDIRGDWRDALTRLLDKLVAA